MPVTHTRKISRAAVAVVTTLLVLGLFGSAPASADAQGCVVAPGPAGSYSCVTVKGRGQYVQDARAIFGVPAPWGGNVCNITAQFSYKYAGESSYRTWTHTSNTCAVARGWVGARFNNRKMANGSKFCARQKNSVTGYGYTNWACVWIRA